MIVVDDSLTCQLGYALYLVGVVHAVELNLEGWVIGIAHAAGAVELSSVNVDDKRLAGHLLGMDAGRIGEPVMGMDYIEAVMLQFLTGNDACYDGIVVDFLQQVLGIFARELDTSEVVGVEVAEVSVDAVAQVVVFLRIHHMTLALLYVVPIDVLPYHWRIRCANDVYEVFDFVALWLWQDKGNITFSCVDDTAYDTERSGSQTTEDMRRPFPAKH